jgi:ribonuclease HI
MSNITINTDGGSRGNPGPSAYAFVVKKDNEIIYTENGYLGVSTNNQAEYMGVLSAMKWLTKERTNYSHVTFILDSELVARQLSGVYKIKDDKLKLLAIDIKKLEKESGLSISYVSVPRAENKEADKMVNESLDENMASEN